RQLQVLLVLEQQVVHRPEPALPGRGFGSERRLQRVRMHLLQRKLPPDEPNATVEVLEQQLHRRRRLLAVRAFEVAVLDQRHGRMRRAQHMVGRSDRNNQREAHAACRSRAGATVGRARKAWICATTAAPSPIAAPTRFTEPARTSPIANTPATLVCRESAGSSPVVTKPRSSTATSHSLSQSVLGSAPRNRNTCRIGCVWRSPVSLRRQVTVSMPASREPVRPTSSVRVSSAMFGVAAMRSIRYFDMLAASPGPRTSIQTFFADVDRNTAACPAELPPPTSTTSWSAHMRASIGEAQYQTPRPSIALRLAQSGRR